MTPLMTPRLGKVPPLTKELGLLQIPLGVAHGAGKFYSSMAGMVKNATSPDLDKPKVPSEPIKIGTKFSDIPRNVWSVMNATRAQEQSSQAQAQQQIRKVAAPVTAPVHRFAAKQKQEADKTTAEMEPHLNQVGWAASGIASSTPDIALSGGAKKLKLAAFNSAQQIARSYSDGTLQTSLPIMSLFRSNSYATNALQGVVQSEVERRIQPK